MPHGPRRLTRPTALPACAPKVRSGHFQERYGEALHHSSPKQMSLAASASTAARGTSTARAPRTFFALPHSRTRLFRNGRIPVIGSRCTSAVGGFACRSFSRTLSERATFGLRNERFH